MSQTNIEYFNSTLKLFISNITKKIGQMGQYTFGL